MLLKNLTLEKKKKKKKKAELSWKKEIVKKYKNEPARNVLLYIKFSHRESQC